MNLKKNEDLGNWLFLIGLGTWKESDDFCVI